MWEPLLLVREHAYYNNKPQALKLGSQSRGPLDACGPREAFMRFTFSSKIDRIINFDQIKFNFVRFLVIVALLSPIWVWDIYLK